jgi:hypothetical protein
MPETTHTNVSTHAQPLASGQVVGPGEQATLTDDPHDRALLAEGTFVATETQTDYAGMRRDQLDAYAEGRELDVKGTGKDGAVVAADLAKALAADDKKTNKEA